MSDGAKVALSTRGLENIQLVSCVKTGHMFNQAPWNIRKGTFCKNS